MKLSNLKRVKVYSNWPTVLGIYLSLLNPESKAVNIKNGPKIQVRTKTDMFMIDSIFVQKFYDKAPYDVPKKDAAVIDVGAHIGIFSLYANLGENVQIYSYEPSPQSYKLLSMNIRLNNAEATIHPRNVAVAGNNRPRRLFINPATSEGDSFYGQGPSVEVPCTTLKQILEENKIEKCDFLKMNCEGAEQGILTMVDEDTLRRIKTACILYHHGLTEMQGIIARLQKAQFCVALETKAGVIRAKQHASE